MKFHNLFALPKTSRLWTLESFTVMQKSSLLRNFNEKKHVWAMLQEIGGSAPNPGHYNEQLNQHGRRVCVFREFRTC